MKLISIVFSFRNEAENLGELIKRVHDSLKNLDNWKYELLFVNDDSTDTSLEILLKLQKKYPIKIINMSRKFGIFPCLLAGFRHAKGDCVVSMDSDLQDPPEIIPKMIQEFLNGNEVVHTIREKRLGEPFIKLFLTKIAYKIINKLSEVNLPIEAGDFKLISRKALKNILDQKEYRPYVRGLSVWIGYKQSFIKYVRDPRFAGKAKFSVFSEATIFEFINGITSYSLKPLYVGIFLGFFSLIFSFLLIIYALYTKFAGIGAPGSTGIIVTVSFFAGTILLTLGIVGIYIARIFEQVKGRAQYIIKDIINTNGQQD